MARKISDTNKANGTSFHGIEFTATVDQIVSILGEPSIEENTGVRQSIHDLRLERIQTN